MKIKISVSCMTEFNAAYQDIRQIQHPENIESVEYKMIPTQEDGAVKHDLVRTVKTCEYKVVATQNQLNGWW